MSVRTCQLCGTPLTRLRVAADGGFCSPEHRDQHRLRRGMDRLEAASKVLSLMRRRENPRHIPQARLMCNGALEHWGFFQPTLAVVKAGVTGFAPVLARLATPRVASGVDIYKLPRVTALAGKRAPARLADTSRIGINGRGTRPLGLPRSQKLLAQIIRAPLILLRPDTPAQWTGPRDFGMLRPGVIRVHLDGAFLGPCALEPRRGLALDCRAGQLRPVKSHPLEGKALRVSMGIGFRVLAAGWRDFNSQGPGLQRPGGAAR